MCIVIQQYIASHSNVCFCRWRESKTTAYYRSIARGGCIGVEEPLSNKRFTILLKCPLFCLKTQFCLKSPLKSPHFAQGPPSRSYWLQACTKKFSKSP